MPTGIYIRTPEILKRHSEVMRKLRGCKLTLEHRQKIAEKLKGNKNSSGIIRSLEHRRKISLANLGRKMSDEARKNISLGHMKELVGYSALHKWVRKNLGKPTRCEHCKKDGLRGHKIHWANINHEYRRSKV